MLKLKNINRNGNIISAEYDPENSGLLGSLSLDIKTGELLSSNISDFEGDMPIYFHHALTGLRSLIIQELIPNEKLIMWY